MIKTKKKRRENPQRKTPKHWHYPEDKVGKCFWMEQYKDTKQHVTIINTESLKTIQVTLTCWITLDNDVSQHELEMQMFYIKYNTKQLLRNWVNPYFRKESIISIDTMMNAKTKREYQYFSIDIVHYVKPNMLYDKMTISQLLTPIYQEIVDNILIENNHCFQITRSKKMDGRAAVAKENKLRKIEQQL